jgi:hypothetical protein
MKKLTASVLRFTFYVFSFTFLTAACTTPRSNPALEAPVAAAVAEQVVTITAVPTPPPPTATTWATAAASPTPEPIATTPTERVNDRPHYDLHVNLDTDAHTVEIAQIVTLPNDSADTWDEVIFNIAPAHWPGIFTLRQASIFQQGVTAAVATSLKNTMLRVPLRQPLPSGESIIIRFDFSLDLPRIQWGGWGPTGNAGWEPGLIQMGDWYPALVPYQSGVGWQTWEFVPVGDPFINSLADYDVAITVPPDVVLAAAGFVAEMDGVHYYQLAQARAFAFLASPNYVFFDDMVNGIPVRVYTTSMYHSRGPVVLETAVNALTLFTELYGPYPYPELILAENGFMTSYEYSGLVSLGGNLFDTYNDGYDSWLVPLTAHEIAHQWWYGSVGNDQVHEPWLDESLAMLSEMLYYEYYHPDLTAWWWQDRVARWQPTGYVDATIYDYPDSPAFINNMYGQAAYFIRDLRETMGESAFHAFLRDYYQQNSHQFVTKATFFTLAQAYSETDLSAVHDIYFGAGKLDILPTE